jgi:DNA-binding LytR/AlgR family response regulator
MGAGIEPKRRLRILVLVWGGLLVFSCARNILTIAFEQVHRAQPIAAAEYVTWEVTGHLAFALVIPAMYWAWRNLQPARVGWPMAVLGHCAAACVVSLMHVAVMILLRKFAYEAAGHRYDPADMFFQFLYEFQKDAFTYAGNLAIIWGLDRILAGLTSAAPALAAVAPVSAAADMVFEVRDGAETRRIAAAGLVRVEAAGNYVELVGGGGHILHRITMSGAEAALRPAGFIRVHRSHLLNPACIRSVSLLPDGDAVAALSNGDRVPVSRRFRGALPAAFGAGDEPIAAQATNP